MSRKDWVVFIVGGVNDRPNQIRYQRIVALSEAFRVVVITNTELPQSVKKYIQEVHVVAKWKATWDTAIQTAKKLREQGDNVYIHTQYALPTAIAGFLCKKKSGCKWVYDLWDHPSLTYRSTRIPLKWVKKFMVSVVLSRVIRKADAWIIAMHPAVLKYLPTPPASCNLILTQPGCIEVDSKTHKNDILNDVIRVIYAGPINQNRIVALTKWAETHNGPFVELHMIGQCNDINSESVLGKLNEACQRNSNIELMMYGDRPHAEVLEILKTAHIGICPLDLSVLNYRYAYPVKVVEQMHFGLIVVATATHGTREFIVDGENGILAPNGTDGMNKALGRAVNICNNPELFESMRNSARETVKEHRWQLVNKRLTKRLKSVVDK